LDPKTELVDLLTNAKGANIFDRYNPALTYLEKSEKDGLAIEIRGLQSSPSTYITASDQHNVNFYGSNFASNNYLGLSKHSSTIEAATEAATTFGVNSAGSPLAFGATKYFEIYSRYYMQLKDEIA
jgi:7-keto-8-aminopelargonate synthetase-like enzyme